MKKYLLYLEPYSLIFISHKTDEILIYNTISYRSIKINNNSKIYKVCMGLLLPENMYFVEIPEELLIDTESIKIIEQIRNTFSGDILISEKGERPVNLPPMLNLQRDINRLKLERNSSIGENIMNYLTEIDVFINSKCTEECKNCQTNYKQFISCSKFLSINDLIYEDIFYRVLNAGFKNLSKINICGGNIILYPHLQNLIKYLNKFQINKNYLISLKNIKVDIIDKILENPYNSITVPVDLSSNNKKTSEKVTLLNHLHNVEFIFFIVNDKEYEKANCIISDYGLSNVSVIPIYNGRNYDFFKEYVCVNENDILNTQLNKRQIFSKQVLNTNYFGKLIILSNGDVFSNINSAPLGNIYHLSLKDILYNELENPNSWRKIRDQKPCTECIYQWLCPSPSNYEIALGKPNLCNVM